MVGKLDKEIIEKFKEFQKKTEKYDDFDIEEIKFENISLNNEKYFKFIKGKNHYIKKYNLENKGKYPLATGSVKNDSIAYYVNPIKRDDIVTQKCISFNKDGDSQVFYRDYEFLMDRHHIAIVPSELVIAKYLYFAITPYFKKMKFGWGENVADVPTVTKSEIIIPKDLDERFYTSLKIQEMMVEFFEYSFEKIDRIKENIDKRYAIFERLQKALIPSTFIKNYVKIAFGRYAKEKGIDFNITDVEFEIKRIHSDKKNDSDVISKKRMGFTPKTSSSGNINWFSVRDLGEVDGLYINKPNSRKKTTMALIGQSVDKNNTGKSEKLISIKKNDILISFKLTVGVVKIYNSDKPLYCNEAIDILTVDEKVTDSRYVAYNCILEYPRYGTKTNNGITLNDDDKKEIKIFIPKDLEKYSSLEIQKIIADFIEYTENRLQKEFDKMDEGYHNLKRLHKTYLARTFSLIDLGE